MRYLVIVLFLVAAPVSLAADTIFPARYDVSGVSAHSSLNLRAGPGTSNPVVGSLAPDDTGIEVLGIRSGWARIGRGEGTVFASANYLTRQPGQDDFDVLSGLPVTCVGNEPFWSVRFESDGFLSFDQLGSETIDYDLNNFATSANDLRSSSFEGTGEAGPLFGVLRRAECSDGMSDRDYGILLEFFPQVTGGIRHLTGCCRLA